MRKHLIAISAFLLLLLLPLRVADAAGCLQAGTEAGLGEGMCGAVAAPPVETDDEKGSADGLIFLTPASAEDTLYENRWYGRLADYTEIYPQPTRSVAPSRNADDGFVYVTINRRLTNDAGETWYQINYNEFVHGDDLTTSPVSEFRGVELARQPERPFAWVVQEIRPSSAPGEDPNPAFEKLERYDLVEIYDAQPTDDNWVWYDIGDGRWVRQTQFSVVNITERPDEIRPDEYWSEIDLYEQTFKAYEGDRLVFATLISSGLNRWPTDEGLYQVEDRLKEWKMSGSEGLADYYHLEDIPYIMYFKLSRGIALHGTYWHDRFGYKHSHGCVNMTVQDSEWTFTWSADAPNDLWVYVHTPEPPITEFN